MSKYKSCAADLFSRFEQYQLASGRWNGTYKDNLAFFDNYCARKYPNATELTQVMIDGWCKKRETEDPKSCNTRISVIILFLKYLQQRGIHNEIKIPERAKYKPCKYIPHAFTEEELRIFFNVCDNITVCRNDLRLKLRKLQLPIIFRLLFSSGMRSIEVRLLHVKDVDLKTGIVNIRESKGHNQHIIVLDDYMLKIMRMYDKVISRTSLFPNREFFFPSANGTPHKRYWISMNFKELWNKNFDNKAVPYDLRHNYATTNINSWIGHEVEFNAKLVYLSKTMGHSCFQCTSYYYSLVPALGDIVRELSNERFNEIIPDIDYEDY